MTSANERISTPIRILVVDDDPEALARIGALLGRRGYAVTPAASGERAQALLAAAPFDLVIADHRVAPADGWAARQETEAATPSRPLIIVTGPGDLDGAASASPINADDFVHKPVSAETLFARIDSCLARQALAQRCQAAEATLMMTRRAMESLDVGLAICDATGPDYPVRYVNRAFEQLTGYPADAVVGRDMRFLRGDGSAPATVAEIRTALQTRTAYCCDILNYRRDGRPFWNHLTISPVCDDAGQVTQFIATLMDVSPRLAMENRLRESEARFRQLSESIDEVFWLTNADMTQTFYISPAYGRMWNHSCEALQRAPETRFSRIRPSDRFKVISCIQPPPQQPYELNYQLESRHGDRQWIRERGFPVKDASGAVFRLAVVFSDITEEKRLQEEMETRMQQVVHADRLAAIGEVVAGVAHEINNPNSFITYNIPLLEETWQAFLPIVAAHARQHPGNGIAHLSFAELMADMTEIIAAIKTGSERINRIVTNLKDFARLDESTHFQPVNINTVVERAMTIVGAQMRKSVDVVAVETTDPIPNIQGHPQKLEQVVVNLLVNAAHAIPQKTAGRITVRTRVVARLDAVLLEVEDNGAGIGAQHMERLFEPFFTTRRTEGGTGLGLSVSYGLVKEHGGTIGVLSRPDRGSCFKVFLPLSRTAPLELNPTILCVDDQPAVLKLVRSMLIKTEDRFVKTVANPAQVIDFLAAHPEIDIVISDILMPKISGWQLLKDIRARFPLIGVILFSGRADALTERPDPSASPDALLAKPFERADLIQAIHSVGRMKL